MTDEPRDAHPDEAALQRYADGDLDPARDDRLSAHVEGCAECRAHVARVQRVTAFMALSSKAPDSLRARIESRRAPRRRRRVAVAVGSLAAAAVLAVALMRDRPARDPAVDATAKDAKSATPTAVVYTATLRDWHQPAADSTLRALRDPRTRVEITHTPRLEWLADSAIGYLVRNGVARERARIVAGPGGVPDALTITVFR